MRPDAIVVLSCIGLATLGMWYYARVLLPRRLEERLRDSVRAFATAIELRAPSHKGLTARAVSLGHAVGHALGLSARDLRDLEMAAELRDIGLCAVSFRLLNAKPWVDWTDADRADYFRHPEVSAAMLELVPSLRHLSGIVRCHHVAFDGSSGPVFPSKSDIPIQARILAAVCEYVWLERMQGALLARERIRDGAGASFDPDVVRAFLGVLTSSRVGEPQCVAA